MLAVSVPWLETNLTRTANEQRFPFPLKHFPGHCSMRLTPAQGMSVLTSHLCVCSQLDGSNAELNFPSGITLGKLPSQAELN